MQCHHTHTGPMGQVPSSNKYIAHASGMLGSIHGFYGSMPVGIRLENLFYVESVVLNEFPILDKFGSNFINAKWPPFSRRYFQMHFLE